ncbi:MAG TPA: TIGR01777 family oxidoreductase [Saprospiraceae bacterium]|nr:TIGR01777 family oxidoreductase [Saprospiraceae bacterium]
MNHPSKTVLIGGGTGLIGNRLSVLLRDKGYQVLHLSRQANPSATFPAFAWNPAQGTIDENAVQQADYVINLAGAGIADKPWTAARKQLIIESRVQSTRLLLQTFQKTGKQPLAFISSAAMGIYGDTGDREVVESDPSGTGFLAESCMAWEQAINEVTAAGIRTVGLRISIVLSTQGGALAKLLLPIRFHAGAYFGDGQQWYSWIHLDDVSRMFVFAIENDHLTGYYNASAPNPVRNKDFTQQIVRAMRKLAVIAPAPAFALRAAMGEMADVILNSNRLRADRITQSGFQFDFPELDGALRDLIARKI